MEENSPDAIVESRQELMICPTGQGNPILRTAHFLKPNVTSNVEDGCHLSSLSLQSLPPTFDPQKWPLNVNFHGWRNPPKKWKEWVEKMVSLHEPTWRKVGIHKAILNSTYQIHKNSDLILGITERWCPQTNSFIFPWGEAAITLEDMLISGYSVLGCPVFKPLETEELKAIEEKMIQARSELVKSSAKKASQGAWLNMFMNSGSELEHEAFLSLWLSRFVLPTSFDVISDSIFPVAIHLSRGTRIALAPALLATIYRDLSLLKEKIVSLAANSDNVGENNEPKLAVSVFSPFQLVQVWVLERFLKLRPKPALTMKGEPRLARWNNVKCKFKNLRQILDSSKASFVWRPYARALGGRDSPKFYGEKEMWVSVDSGLDEELESFIRCLRVSELVGVGADCIEQYLPHRVGRQFGMDQDVPGFVARSNDSRENAWSCYNRPITDVKCYVPSGLSETDITTRYFEWWEHSELVLQSASKRVAQWQKGSTRLGVEPRSSEEQQKMQKFVSSFKMTRKDLKGTKAVTMKNKRVSGSKRKKVDDPLLASGNVGKKLKTLAKRSTGRGKGIDRSSSLKCSSDSEKTMHPINKLLVPPGFPPKSNQNETEDVSDEDDLPITLIIRSRKKHDGATTKTSDDRPPNLSVWNGLNDDNQSASGEYVSDSSSNEAGFEDGVGSNGETALGSSAIHSSSSSHDNEDQTVLDVTSGKNLKLNEASETHQGVDGENVSSESGQSQSHLPRTTNKSAIIPNPMTGQDAASLSDKTHSSSRLKEGNGDGAFEPSILKLEDEITRLEKMVAELKAGLFSNSRRLNAETCYPSSSSS